MSCSSCSPSPTYKTDPEARRLQDIEDLLGRTNAYQERYALTEDDYSKIVPYLFEFYKVEDRADLKRRVDDLSRRFNRTKILKAYRRWSAREGLRSHALLEDVLIAKKVRSDSGVLVITVFTSPHPEDENGRKQSFSCKWDCFYCPNEPGQPRSYLLKEPGVQRANQHGFDAIAQLQGRLANLEEMGHPLDKLEILVLGGTWESYPQYYRETFIRDLFYGANTYFDKLKAEKRALADEQRLNETALCKIIGITIETRPDTVTRDAVREFRRLGVTRVQIGVQHTNDSILHGINRRCTREQIERGIAILKDNGFKVDIHLMPDLPFSSPALDREMFYDVIYRPELQADQWKIYPCEVVPWTKIKEWHEAGLYTPYGKEPLTDLLLEIKPQVKPWVRINRVIRDIPSEYIIAGNDDTGLRDEIHKRLRQMGTRCGCIRCREVRRGDPPKKGDARIYVEPYYASEGKEYFISYENSDRTKLYGFLRLRVPVTESKWCAFPSLKETAWIRELHVYGVLQSTYDQNHQTNAQHRGIGTMLLKMAESIARKNKKRTITVISGVGVKNYYRRRGYTIETEGGYLQKSIDPLTGVIKTMKAVGVGAVLVVLMLIYLFAMSKAVGSL